jgi:hypothetical protein
MTYGRVKLGYLLAVYIRPQGCGTYSIHQFLTGKKATPTPILTSRAQQLPISAAALLLSAWYPVALKQMMDLDADPACNGGDSEDDSFLTLTAMHSRGCGAQGASGPNIMERIEVCRKPVAWTILTLIMTSE